MSENIPLGKSAFLQKLLSPITSRLTQGIKVKKIIPKKIIDKKAIFNEVKSSQKNNFLFADKRYLYNINNNSKNIQINNTSNNNIFHFK